MIFNETESRMSLKKDNKICIICHTYKDFLFKWAASAKSIGALLVSARAPMKNIINIGNNGIINHIDFWDSTISVKFKLPVNKIIRNIAELKINS